MADTTLTTYKLMNMYSAYAMYSGCASGYAKGYQGFEQPVCIKKHYSLFGVY